MMLDNFIGGLLRTGLMKIFYLIILSIIEIPYLNFIDINYKEDWKIAEQLYNLKLKIILDNNKCTKT